MTPETFFRYKNLINALDLFAASFEYLKEIDSATFDVEFELSSEFDIGLQLENIDYLFMNKIISENVKDKILEFRSFILLIPDSFWEFNELEANPVWDDVRIRANAILDLMNEHNREFDFSVVKLI